MLGAAPDTRWITLFADAFPPALRTRMGPVGWVPTIELTVHVRRRPASGWVVARFDCDDVEGKDDRVGNPLGQRRRSRCQVPSTRTGARPLSGRPGQIEVPSGLGLPSERGEGSTDAAVTAIAETAIIAATKAVIRWACCRRLLEGLDGLMVRGTHVRHHWFVGSTVRGREEGWTVPGITNIHHVALTVTNVDRSAEWYSDLLGVQVAVLSGDSDEVRFRVLADMSSGTAFGLREYPATEGSRFDEFRTGLDHLAFGVARPDGAGGMAGRARAPPDPVLLHRRDSDRHGDRLSRSRQHPARVLAAGGLSTDGRSGGLVSTKGDCDGCQRAPAADG